MHWPWSVPQLRGSAWPAHSLVVAVVVAGTHAPHRIGHRTFKVMLKGYRSHACSTVASHPSGSRSPLHSSIVDVDVDDDDVLDVVHFPHSAGHTLWKDAPSDGLVQIVASPPQLSGSRTPLQLRVETNLVVMVVVVCVVAVVVVVVFEVVVVVVAVVVVVVVLVVVVGISTHALHVTGHLCRTPALNTGVSQKIATPAQVALSATPLHVLTHELHSTGQFTFICAWPHVELSLRGHVGKSNRPLHLPRVVVVVLVVVVVVVEVVVVVVLVAVVVVVPVVVVVVVAVVVVAVVVVVVPVAVVVVVVVVVVVPVVVEVVVVAVVVVLVVVVVVVVVVVHSSVR